jgi:hypothetical protein
MGAFAIAQTVFLTQLVQLHRRVMLSRTAAVMDLPRTSTLLMDAFAIAQEAFPMQLVQLHHPVMLPFIAVVMVQPQT